MTVYTVLFTPSGAQRLVVRTTAVRADVAFSRAQRIVIRATAARADIALAGTQRIVVRTTAVRADIALARTQRIVVFAASAGTNVAVPRAQAVVILAVALGRVARRCAFLGTVFITCAARLAHVVRSVAHLPGLAIPVVDTFDTSEIALLAHFAVTALTVVGHARSA